MDLIGSAEEPSSVVGLHVLTTEYVSGTENELANLPTEDCGRNVIAIPNLPSESSSSILEKDGEITLHSSFIPENAVLMETPRGLMLTVPENISAISYGEDSSPDAQPQQLLSCIPVSLFSASVDVDSSGGYGSELSTEAEMENSGVVESGDNSQNSKPVDNVEITSDQSVTETATEACVTTKRKGGWPKGKKRKIKPIVTGPRAPVTGYVLYTMDRRKEIKDSHPEIAFSEVTKILGQEWSTMAPDVKQKYLAAAEEDKKRYREELKAFKSSEEYKETIGKRMLSNGEIAPLQESDILNCEDGNLDELYCKLCDVYFNNLHNKREHMYGKVHVQNVSDAMKKRLHQQQQNDEHTLTDGALVMSEELSQDAYASSLRSNGNVIDNGEVRSGPVDIHGFMMDFVHKNYERELEISVLKKCLSKSVQDNVTMCKEIQTLQAYQNKLQEDHKALDAANSALIGQSDALKMIPTLFGIINL